MSLDKNKLALKKIVHVKKIPNQNALEVLLKVNKIKSKSMSFHVILSNDASWKGKDEMHFHIFISGSYSLVHAYSILYLCSANGRTHILVARSQDITIMWRVTRHFEDDNNCSICIRRERKCEKESMLQSFSGLININNCDAL